MTRAPAEETACSREPLDHADRIKIVPVAVCLALAVVTFGAGAAAYISLSRQIREMQQNLQQNLHEHNRLREEWRKEIGGLREG